MAKGKQHSNKVAQALETDAGKPKRRRKRKLAGLVGLVAAIAALRARGNKSSTG